MKLPSPGACVVMVYLPAVIILAMAACSGSPPKANDLQTAVNLSRDACQRLLDATEAPLPEASGGEGGGP